MKRLLLLATTLCLAASAMAAEQGGMVKQTTIRYNVPTCENCKTTNYEETVFPAPRPVARPPMPAAPCASCGMATPCPQGQSSCIDNNKLGIAHPLFFVKPGQVSLETIGSVWKQPKGAYKKDGDISGEMRGYDAAERIYVGLYKRLALHLEGGYAFQAPKTKQYKADMGAPVPHYSSYDGTVGLSYHLIDTCPFDMMVGVDGTWGRAVEKRGEYKDGANYTFVTPNLVAGFNWSPRSFDSRGRRNQFVLSPYIKAAYSFAHSSDHDLSEDFYHIAPGLYVQLNKYLALDFSAEKIEHQKWQYNAGFDVYPVPNLAIGMNVHAKKPLDDPMYVYGAAAHIKLLF